MTALALQESEVTDSATRTCEQCGGPNLRPRARCCSSTCETARWTAENSERRREAVARQRLREQKTRRVEEPGIRSWNHADGTRVFMARCRVGKVTEHRTFDSLAAAQTWLYARREELGVCLPGNRALHDVVCGLCGETFAVRPGSAKYCPDCRLIAEKNRRARDAEKQRNIKKQRIEPGIWQKRRLNGTTAFIASDQKGRHRHFDTLDDARRWRRESGLRQLPRVPTVVGLDEAYSRIRRAAQALDVARAGAKGRIAQEVAAAYRAQIVAEEAVSRALKIAHSTSSG